MNFGACSLKENHVLDICVLELASNGVRHNTVCSVKEEDTHRLAA
jgi:hypothetical protein